MSECTTTNGSAPATSRTESAACPLLLDAGEAAALVGFGRSTWFRYDDQGLIPRGVRIGRVRRWPADELRRWIAAGCPPRVRWEAAGR